MVVDQLGAIPNEAARLTSERCPMWMWVGPTRKPAKSFHVYDLPRLFTEINQYSDDPGDPERDKCDLACYSYCGIKEHTTPSDSSTIMEMNYHRIGECKVRKIWSTQAYAPQMILCIQFQKTPYNKATVKLRNFDGGPLHCPRTWYWKMLLPFCNSFSEIIPEWLDACHHFRRSLGQFPQTFFEYGCDQERTERADQLVRSIEFPSGRPVGKTSTEPDGLRHTGVWYIVGRFHYLDTQQENRSAEDIRPAFAATDGSVKVDPSLPASLVATTRPGYYSKPYIAIWSGPDGMYDPVSLTQLTGPVFSLLPTWDGVRDKLVRTVREKFNALQEAIEVALAESATEARDRLGEGAGAVAIRHRALDIFHPRKAAIKRRFLRTVQKLLPEIEWPLMSGEEVIAEVMEEPALARVDEEVPLGPYVGHGSRKRTDADQGGREEPQPDILLKRRRAPSQEPAAAAEEDALDGGGDSGAAGVGLFGGAPGGPALPPAGGRTGSRPGSRAGSRAGTPGPAGGDGSSNAPGGAGHKKSKRKKQLD